MKYLLMHFYVLLLLTTFPSAIKSLYVMFKKVSGDAADGAK